VGETDVPILTSSCHVALTSLLVPPESRNLPQTGLLNARLIVQMYRPSVIFANIVIDTSAILAVLLAEPEKQAVVEATMGSTVRACVAAVAGRERGCRRREEAPADAGRARQLVTDFAQVTIRELAVDLRRAVDLGLELRIARAHTRPSGA